MYHFTLASQLCKIELFSIVEWLMHNIAADTYNWAHQRAGACPKGDRRLMLDNYDPNPQ